MTYVIGGADVNDFDELIHYGKKGMKWGVRNDKPSGGSGRSASAPAKPRPKLTPEQRLKIGKQVAIAVVAAAGGIGVTALGGPIAGTAAGAAIRGILAELTNEKELTSITNRANEIRKEAEESPFYNYKGPQDLAKIAANSGN